MPIYTLLTTDGATIERNLEWKTFKGHGTGTKLEAVCRVLDGGPVEKIWCNMVDKWLWVLTGERVFNPGVSILCGRNIYGDALIEGRIE